jgi:hypothetical protein
MFLKILQVYRTFPPIPKVVLRRFFDKSPKVLFAVVASAKS